jgi:hypothetical protein
VSAQAIADRTGKDKVGDQLPHPIANRLQCEAGDFQAKGRLKPAVGPLMIE